MWIHRFKQIKATYLIDLIICCDNIQNSYSSKIEIVVMKNLLNNSIVTLQKNYDTLINGQYPEKVMDYLMMELGNSLYPVSFIVTENGNCKVVDFEQTLARWEQCSSKLLKEHSTIEFKNYVEFSRTNLTEEGLIQIFLRNTFCHLFFADINSDRVNIECCNFPRLGHKTMYCSLNNRKFIHKEDKIHYDFDLAFDYPNVNGNGFLDYTLFPQGDIQSIKGEFNYVDEDDRCHKKLIKVSVVDKPKRKVIR